MEFVHDKAGIRRKKVNNAVGVKGKSGRKSLEEELRRTAEVVTQEMLIKLANKRVMEHLKKMSGNYNKAKEMALPITLKGIKEVKDINVKVPKPLDTFADLQEDAKVSREIS